MLGPSLSPAELHQSERHLPPGALPRCARAVRSPEPRGRRCSVPTSCSSWVPVPIFLASQPAFSQHVGATAYVACIGWLWEVFLSPSSHACPVRGVQLLLQARSQVRRTSRTSIDIPVHLTLPCPALPAGLRAGSCYALGFFFF